MTNLRFERDNTGPCKSHKKTVTIVDKLEKPSVPKLSLFSNPVILKDTDLTTKPKLSIPIQINLAGKT